MYQIGQSRFVVLPKTNKTPQEIAKDFKNVPNWLDLAKPSHTTFWATTPIQVDIIF